MEFDRGVSTVAERLVLRLTALDPYDRESDNERQAAQIIS
jgi:hypothetical protein